ncbi:MAG: 5-aminolevulinate synthase [Rhodospirillaceae bacterium]|nr:5-aminolevulinate synthase [Rhodospirillaceae bacterium]
MNYQNFFSDELSELKKTGDYRVFADLEREAGAYPNAIFREGGQKSPITVWCSNDYLGQGQNTEVIAAMHEALDYCGAGAGGTRNISGTNHYHVLLEQELADLHQREAALLFTSGYVANMTTLSTLGMRMPGCLLYSDARNHNSMIEGIRHSRAEKRIFKHNNPADLDRLMRVDDPDAPKIVVFESVYSMDGDIAPIGEILDVCDKYNALSYLDEVHAVGMYGETGAGVAERDGVMDRVSVMQGTLAKGFGVVGGYIAATRQLIDFVRSFGNGFIFTTSMPPAVAAGALASVKYVRGAQHLRKKHHERATTLKAKLTQAGIPVMPSVSHIVPVLVGDPRLCKQASDALLDRFNIYVQPINYPTVARGTERLRITPTPLHTDAMMDDLVAALVKIWCDLNLTPAS